MSQTGQDTKLTVSMEAVNKAHSSKLIHAPAVTQVECIQIVGQGLLRRLGRQSSIPEAQAASRQPSCIAVFAVSARYPVAVE
ncbi:hypothetical protein PsorP6_008055 [Peronosclerospora sorghi]|uniref:Uncharacterized protein n=1 Tax=Peronosclerospora sorghi TaxID=230839 RepID=A0ACC0W9D9_9STRA|nr:hypothetical protein PsorP6_008055 [Peronosclerospora sorghi]